MALAGIERFSSIKCSYRRMTSYYGALFKSSRYLLLSYSAKAFLKSLKSDTTRVAMILFSYLNVSLTLKCHLSEKTNQMCTTFNQKSPGGVLLGIFGGGVPPASPNPDPISDQNTISHTRFQNWPQKSIPVFRPDLAREACACAERKST